MNWLLWIGFFILAQAALLCAAVFILRRKAQREILKVADRTSETWKEKMRSVREEKNRIFAVFESMAEGVVVVDTHRKILLVNSVLARMLGTSENRLEGRYFWEVFRDSAINAMMEHGLTQKTPVSKELSPLFSESVFAIQVSPVSAEGEFLGVVAVFHDVTQLKKLERSRSEFVANVSHELKTPLTSILGFVETLKEGAIDDAQNRMKFLQIIEDHSKKLHLLIKDLLLLSKVESGAGMERRPVDLAPLLQRVVDSFDRALKAKKIRVSLEITPIPFRVTADPASLEEALSNLMDNAIRYNAPAGQIAVKAGFEDSSARIQISDTGIGIPQNEIPRIFERFYRVDKSRSRESGGTGLGLSIAKHIVERHAGRIEVESQEQKGSTFTIFLPRE